MYNSLPTLLHEGTENENLKYICSKLLMINFEGFNSSVKVKRNIMFTLKYEYIECNSLLLTKIRCRGSKKKAKQMQKISHALLTQCFIFY